MLNAPAALKLVRVCHLGSVWFGDKEGWDRPTTTQNLLRGIFKMASEVGGPAARLGYSWQGSWPSNRLG